MTTFSNWILETKVFLFFSAGMVIFTNFLLNFSSIQILKTIGYYFLYNFVMLTTLLVSVLVFATIIKGESFVFFDSKIGAGIHFLIASAVFLLLNIVFRKVFEIQLDTVWLLLLSSMWGIWARYSWIYFAAHQ